MALVLARTYIGSHFKACSTRSIRFFSRSYQSLFFFILLSLAYIPSAVLGQAFAKNGQYFTKGLAISDSPAPGSPEHAASNLVIALDLSGDGKIPQSSFDPSSSASTHYDSLEIYLVSSQSNLNLTVSNGSTLLTQEPGSTVKHLNWQIPDCIPPAEYNLTYYEYSHINNGIFYSITPLAVNIDNTNQNKDTSACDALSNPLETQPQVDSAPAINPYLDPNSGLSDTQSSSATFYTITLGESGFPTQWTIEPSGSVITATEPLTTVTLVVVSSETLTETASTGQASTFITTSMTATTVTAVMAPSAIDVGGFLPVNSALSKAAFPGLLIYTFISCIMFIL